MKSYEYSVFIVLRGDPGAIECTIDEIMNVIPAMDLDSVSIRVDNQTEVDDG